MSCPAGGVMELKAEPGQKLEYLRQQADMFLLMMDAVKDYAIYMLDPEGRVLTWNEGAKRIKGYSKEEIVGEPFSRFYLPEDIARGVPAQELATALRDGTFKEEGWRVRKDGSLFWASITITRIRDSKGELKGYAKITRDLSDWKRAQDELRSAKDEAERSSLLKSQFVANISHEIRTPLSGILGMAELLLEMDLGEEARDIANHIFASSKGLFKIVNQLLDFSRIESGRMQLEQQQFSIGQLLNNVAVSIKPAADKKKLKINVKVADGIPDTVLGDAQRVEQVLLNLAHNAVKFTATGKIEITSRCQHQEDHTVRVHFAVQDTGIGMNPDAQKHLFEPFVQADGSTTRLYGGTGLGLSISQGLVKAMGGNIGFSSEEGKGSLFWFEIPLVRETSP